MYDLRLFVEYNKQAKKIPDIRLLFPKDINKKVFLVLYKNAIYQVYVEKVTGKRHPYNELSVYLSIPKCPCLGSFMEDTTVSTMNINNLIYFLDRIQKPELTEEEKTKMEFEYNELMKKDNNAR